MKLAYILSLPRSGSTVLSAMLDRRRGVVSPPESVFPQVLGALSKGELRNPRWLAALYLKSTFVPTPLSLDDAESCMHGTIEEMLCEVGRAVAEKLGRDRAAIDAVVWKTPRMVGMHAGPLSTDGCFVVLRRNPHNVFESQFRVGFGENNRRPLRFAAFRESYENAFDRLPRDRTIEIEYDDLPGAVGDILNFVGLEDRGEWEGKAGSLDMAAASVAHMTEVTKEFTNRDPEKRARLDAGKIKSLDRALKLARPLRGVLGPLRAHFDGVSYARVRRLATELLEEEGKTK